MHSRTPRHAGPIESSLHIPQNRCCLLLRKRLANEFGELSARREIISTEATKTHKSDTVSISIRTKGLYFDDAPSLQKIVLLERSEVVGEKNDAPTRKKNKTPIHSHRRNNEGQCKR